MVLKTLPKLQRSYKAKHLLYDRLIRIFVEKKEQTEWRKMIAFSKNWNYVASEVFKRMDDLEIEHRDKPAFVAKLETMKKNLFVLHNELNYYNKIISDFKRMDDLEIEHRDKPAF